MKIFEGSNKNKEIKNLNDSITQIEKAISEE